jgi:hypothetical protein
LPRRDRQSTRIESRVRPSGLASNYIAVPSRAFSCGETGGMIRPNDGPREGCKEQRDGKRKTVEEQGGRSPFFMLAICCRDSHSRVQLKNG